MGSHPTRIAYVTGGMGGIGTAICRRLCKEGHTVIAGCREARAEEATDGARADYTDFQHRACSAGNFRS